MAVETIYKPTFQGSFLTTSGDKTDNVSEAVEFDSLSEANDFVEASGSVGEYHIRTYTIKS